MTLDDSKSPNMGQGFSMIRDGEPALFLEGLTVWNRWLPKEEPMPMIKAAAQVRKPQAVAASAAK